MHKAELNRSNRKHNVTVRSVSRTLCLILHPLYLLLLLLPCLASCHYPRPDLEDRELGERTRDSLRYLYERHYTWDTNLELLDDSVTIACLPVKDCYNTLYRGDRVVVCLLYTSDAADE